MGLARELSMGPKRTRERTIAAGPVWDRLRNAREAHKWGRPVDDEQLLEDIRTVSAQRTRMRFAEGAIYNDACKVYADLTGKVVGPTTGTF